MALTLIACGYGVLSAVGVRWGLPTRAADRYLFSTTPPLTGAQIVARTGSGTRGNPAVGADVDTNPVQADAQPVVLNEIPARQAEIYRRYRLFTHQPDEMITLMALSGMHPGALKLDPRLYQYGGLFIYPVGGLIAAAAAAGWVDLDSDPAYYLDHPDSFGRFYIVARLYAAVWGLVGVWIVYRIASVLAGAWTGVLAGGLFALLPVVVCMSHEAKPHLGGAVLMLAAVWFAMRALRRQSSWDWAGLYVCCGASVGMVLSSWPIGVLIPLVVGMHCIQQHRRQINERTACREMVNYRPVFVRGVAGGLVIACVTYLVFNPYILINAIANRAVLASNFGNSLGMYDVSRIRAGGVRTLQLTLHGATVPVVLLGLAACAVAIRRRAWIGPVLWVPAGLFVLQFALIGAGKPDEYGRFIVFPAAVLAIGAAIATASIIRRRRAVGAVILVTVLASCALADAGYLHAFRADANGQGSRAIAARQLAGMLARLTDPAVAVAVEPAPYSCPPLDFGTARVVLYRSAPHQPVYQRARDWLTRVNKTGPNAAEPVFVVAVDDPERFVRRVNPNRSINLTVCESRRPAWLPRGKISWADKPIVILDCLPRRHHDLPEARRD